MPGLTLDTGALIALERGDKRMRARLLAAEQDGERITVPAAVLSEWWQGDSDRQRAILVAVDVEPVAEEIGKLAGEAMTARPGANAIDALVMASAALRGDVVYTSDFNELYRLQTHLRAVHRVLRV
jgi:predicted nucleic acid-binding protein